MAKALAFTPPVYRDNNAGSYIEFRAYDPAFGDMRRKRIKLNSIKSNKIRKQFASDYIKRLNSLLAEGWNPWINPDMDNLQGFADGLDRYDDFIFKQLTCGIFRKQTYDDYRSKIKILREFIETRKPLKFMYQFDKKFCVDFLDYIYIERNNGAQTFNNYLTFLRTISQWFVERGMLDKRPTDGLSPINKRLYHKERECIPSDVVAKIGEWTRANDPHFAFACELLYYCFIRPVEMTRLKVRDFNLKEGTVTIHADQSKNKTTQIVTVPRHVLLHGVELGIFSAPVRDYIFSRQLKPGAVEIDPKIFRDHWAKVSKTLNLRKEWKFYSLKDTGISEMLERGGIAPVNVKDQARHSSLAITEIYLDKHRKKAVPEILDLEGAL